MVVANEQATAGQSRIVPRFAGERGDPPQLDQLLRVGANKHDFAAFGLHEQKLAHQ